MCDKTDSCDLAMVTIETDDGTSPQRVCPVCDDVQVETLDGGGA